MPIPTTVGMGIRRICVTIPEGEPWFTTLKSVIYKMTRGRFWDRDTGVIVDTQQIARAIYNSVQDCSDDCDNSGVEQRLDEIIALLGGMTDSEMNNITINNTVSGGGCGCGGSSTTTNTTGGGDVPDITEVYDMCVPGAIEYEMPEDENYNDFKCNASQYMIAKMRETVIGLLTLYQVAETELEEVEEYLRSVWEVVPDEYELLWVVWYWLTERVFSYLAEPVVNSIVNWLDDNATILADMLWCSSDSVDARQQMELAIDTSNLTVVAKRVIKWVVEVANWRILYLPEGERSSIPEYGHQCSCGEVPSDYEYDVTIDTTDEVQLPEEYWEFHPNRSGFSKDGFIFINAMDTFPLVGANLKKSGVIKAIRDHIGDNSVSEVDIRLIEFGVTGNEDGTCADGYTHRIMDTVLDDPIFDPVPVGCSPAGVYQPVGGAFSPPLVTVGLSSSSSVFGMSQTWENQTTNLSETKVGWVRIAGNITERLPEE